MEVLLRELKISVFSFTAGVALSKSDYGFCFLFITFALFFTIADCIFPKKRPETLETKGECQ